MIANAFAKGSSRLLEKRGAPPNLPGVSANFTPLPDSLSGDALLKKAEKRELAARSPDQDEIDRLRRELEQVKTERDFLKKAAAFFAKHQ